jgi:hypothetical protein
MFVRWKHRPVRRRRETSLPNERALYAVLVESHRVDGKPRQRVVRYLAAIRGGQLVYPLSTDRFWQDVERTLADLALADDQRQVIEDKIAATVPRPDPAVVEQQQVEVKELATAIATMVAGRGRRRRTATHDPLALP